jgi:hypothetical protein
MSEMTNKDLVSKQSKASEKKAYLAPAFRSERVFEVSALSCGKISATQASCRSNRKVS